MPRTLWDNQFHAISVELIQAMNQDIYQTHTVVEMVSLVHVV